MHKLLNNEKIYSALAAYLCGERLPHALLLEGPTGCGKLTLAQEIAQGALCTAPPAEKPCGECRDCVKVAKVVHPDVLFYGGDGGSKSFHLEQVRELRSQAYVRPGEGSCKVLILRDVHNMTVQAQNALLKIIEEPPKNVRFILTCENKATLLTTILSRVSVFSLEVPTIAQCVQVLAEQAPGIPAERYQQAAREANGVVGQALTLLTSDGDTSRYAEALRIFTALILGDEMDALALLAKYERDRIGFAELLSLMNGLAVELLRQSDTEIPEFGRLRSRVSPLQLMRILAIIEECTLAGAGNVSGLLLVTALCAKIKLALA